MCSVLVSNFCPFLSFRSQSQFLEKQPPLAAFIILHLFLDLTVTLLSPYSHTIILKVLVLRALAISRLPSEIILWYIHALFWYCWLLPLLPFWFMTFSPWSPISQIMCFHWPPFCLLPSIIISQNLIFSPFLSLYFFFSGAVSTSMISLFLSLNCDLSSRPKQC